MAWVAGYEDSSGEYHDVGLVESADFDYDSVGGGGRIVVAVENDDGEMEYATAYDLTGEYDADDWWDDAGDRYGFSSAG